jgi:hypothetical protein
MPYKIYTDRDGEFTCEVSAKNASLDGSIARIVLSSSGLNIINEGHIKNGKCVVPIKKVKGLLKEYSIGKIHLELIVDNMYFRPWESSFQVEENTSVAVRVNEQHLPSAPPVVVHKSPPQSTIQHGETRDLMRIFEKYNVSKKTLRLKRPQFKQIVREYFKMSPESRSLKPQILREIATFFH